MSERADANIDKEKVYMYNALTTEEHSIFYKRHTSDVFVAAAAIGFHDRQSEKLKPGNRYGLFIVNNMSKNSPGYWILKAIGVSQLGIDSLKNLSEVVNVCQDYANYGIEVLYKLHKYSSNEEQEIVDKMLTILEENEII